MAASAQPEQPPPDPPMGDRGPPELPPRADLGPRLLAAVGYATFAILALDRLGQGPIQALDPGLFDLVPHSGPLATVSQVATHLGDQATVTAIALLGVLVLLLRSEYIGAGALALAKAVSVVVVYGLKALIGRARPVIAPGSVSSAAFPSGHATEAAMVFMLVAVLLFDRHRRLRPWAEGIAIGLALVVGATRVVIGAHWPTDVVAGWGLGWGLAGTFLLLRAWLERKKALPHLAPRHEVTHSVSLSLPERIQVHDQTRLTVEVEDVPEERPLPSTAHPLHPEERGGLV